MSDDLSRDEIRSLVRSRAGKPEVPGPSNNPATNIMLADIIIRAVGRISRQSIQKTMLGKQYGTEFAAQAVNNKSLIHALATYGVTRFATKSVPGAIVVGGVAAAKILFDHGKSRRQARREGREFLEKQADPDSMA